MKRLVFGVVVAVLLAGGSASLHAATVTAGFGHAAAQTFQIDPRTAGLSYSVTFGQSIADHQNTVARAQAQTANFGLIGTAATAPTCTGDPAVFKPEWLPKPVRVDSRDAGADEGKSETSGPFTQSARATTRPFAVSSTTIAPLDLGGVVSFLGGKSESTSGPDKSDKPQAIGSVDISGISIVGGVVELRGLHWRSASQADKQDPSSSFSIDSLTIGGIAVPNPSSPNAIEAANLVLGPLGLFLGLPKIHTENGTTFVDPLRVGIVPSETRDSLVRNVTTGIQPIRQAVFQYLLDNTPCQYSPAAAILVADIITLSVTGGGSMAFNVGGTQAQTISKLPGASFDFGGSNGGTLPAIGAAPTSGPFVLGGDTAPNFLPPTEVFSDATPNGSRRALPASSTNESDNAKWVALAVIGLGLVLVEGELRLRRRSAAGGVS